MREILFRGKTTKKEEEIHTFHNVWVEGDLIKNREKWHIHPKSNCFRSEKELAKCMIAHEVIPETVGQYTGLTDKNGKKIFEGDIVKDLGGSMDGIPRVVFWNEEWMEFECYLVKKHWAYGTNCCRLWCIKDKELEVIGNKWDNPELLGE